MKEITSGTKLLLGSAAIMWLIEIVNLFFNHQLSHYGIVPREVSGLIGIVLSPFLHWSLPHLIGNTIPFVILGFLVHQSKQLVFVSLVVALGGGLLVWLFARDAAHAGASGLIMGYFGFLISHGLFTRSIRSILISIVAVIFYGGIVFSLLDFRSHISFEGHIFGFIAGVAAAWYLGKSPKLLSQ
jgi:membrane associated rhomboid family serine protease